MPDVEEDKWRFDGEDGIVQQDGATSHTSKARQSIKQDSDDVGVKIEARNAACAIARP